MEATLTINGRDRAIWLDEAATAYLECALFTADEDIIAPTSGQFDASPHLPRVPASVRAKALADVTAFYNANAADLGDYGARDYGHDLWYSRNGHGVGFFEADHCEKDAAERLQDAARKFGERNLFKQGGWFYIE